MNKVKHTPGPWFTEEDADAPAVVDSKNRIVAQVFWDNKNGPFQGDEVFCNAYLIAAAPDLLEACIAALEVIDELIGADYDITGEQAKCKSAIAKARGSQP